MSFYETNPKDQPTVPTFVEEEKKSTAQTLKNLGFLFLVLGVCIPFILALMASAKTIGISWTLVILIFSGFCTTAIAFYLCAAFFKVLELIEDHLREIRIELVNRPQVK